MPEDVDFATKPRIARKMIAQAVRAKVPFGSVAADSVYGTGSIETMLRKAGKGYVLGVAANHEFHSWSQKQVVGGTAAEIAQNLPKRAWRRLSAGEGTKGPRLHDWAYLELAGGIQRAALARAQSVIGEQIEALGPGTTAGRRAAPAILAYSQGVRGAF